MDEYLGFAIFFLIFITIYAGLNYFVLSQYFKLFGIHKNVWFYLIVGFLALSYIIAAGLESHSSNAVFRGIYVLAAVWMGILFLLFCTLMIYLIVSKIIPIAPLVAGIVMLIFVFLAAAYGIFNAYDIRVDKIDVVTDKNVSITIAQISDLHLGPVNGKSYLKRIVARLNRVDADAVVITGDLLDGRYSYNKDVLHPLNDIKADVFFVSGNHDDYANLTQVAHLLNGTKVRWLRNEAVTYHGVNIVGLDDTRDSKSITQRLSAINKTHDLSKKYTILLNHRPIGWMGAKEYVNLMLSGHTHAGQIWPFSYLVFLEGNVWHGAHKIDDDFMLYVNSGTGTWGPPMRIGSHTQISVFDIHKR